jgi:hypothetical protein
MLASAHGSNAPLIQRMLHNTRKLISLSLLVAMCDMDSFGARGIKFYYLFQICYPFCDIVRSNPDHGWPNIRSVILP